MTSNPLVMLPAIFALFQILRYERAFSDRLRDKYQIILPFNDYIFFDFWHITPKQRIQEINDLRKSDKILDELYRNLRRTIIGFQILMFLYGFSILMDLFLK